MKKLFVLSIAMFAIGTFAANAQASPTPDAAVVQEPVKAAEITINELEKLPASVRQTLASEEFKNLQFVSATLVKDEKGEFYNITLKEGEKATAVKLNTEGKRID